ncbi:trypsin-like peptidase domain-containing protein [Synechococcus sp. PCC 6312]|uniref:trypsin-like peptidase domain-containing protein n=1 Tax=Synechococcus sp. (strain ATCC 27167 / PCC 6312) TaxID=195253 RepID=UPI00029F045A|nr:trypsin-like peptidase domain-containing protein [Synechococcus sp. PCC 6312]AFY60160.1 trypsin-like serine protease with C-terminal PDZ domain [Synechococcus sp. PCC 6312]
MPNQPDSSNSTQPGDCLSWILRLGTGVLAGLVVGCQMPQNNSAGSGSTQVSFPRPALTTATTSANFIADIVAKTSPAIVSIDTSRTTATNPFNPQAPSPEQTTGKGSGFIFSSDGKIITNAHVVAGSEKVLVTLPDGQTFPGQVLGADPLTDIAVVQIAAKNLPTLPVGNSDQLMPGQWAIAIGNPLGLSNTVTAGIISAMGRSSDQIGAADQRVSYIQTDAAINPGNSGGPLLNQEGAVVGVNTAIIQGAQGLGFAIPINTAKRIAEQIIATGQARHLFLGIRMVNLSAAIRDEVNQANPAWQIKQEQGVLVIAVVDNSPAAQAGVQPGDWIAKINNQDRPTARQIQEQVESTPENGTVKLEVERQGKRINLTITPQELQPN